MFVTRAAVAALLLALVPLVSADEAEDAFNQLYGDDLKRVLATPAPADDIALAKQLLDAAQKAEKQPALLALLCEKAYDLAAKDASGYATATAAMGLLGEKVPGKKVEALRKTAAIYQKQYATARADAKTKAGEALIQALSTLAAAQAEAGDIDAAGASLKQALTIATAIKSDAKAAIQAQLEGLAPREKMEKQIAALKAKLEKNPEDAASRKELVRLLLVEEDNPAEAAKFLDESLDDAMRKYVPAAAKPLEDAPELACKELGDWYRGLADQAQVPASKGAMLRRAQGYYERFLDLHKDEDLARTTAALMLKKIEDALARLPAPKAGPGAWIDLLKAVDLSKHSVLGTWKRSGAAIGNTEANSGVRFMSPVPVSGSYELQARVVRVSGLGFFNFILPLKATYFEIGIGNLRSTASTVFLYKIGGSAVSAPCQIESGREYGVHIKVQQEDGKVAVNVGLDGKPVLAWEGPETQVSFNDGWRVPAKDCIGMGAENCVIIHKSAKVRMLSGDWRASPAPAKITTAWTDCLKGVDPVKDAVKGKWAISGGQLACLERSLDCRITLPVAPPKDYEVQASFVRTAGSNCIVLFLPSGQGRCGLVLANNYGQCHSLKSVGGKDPPDPPASSRPGTLINGQEYLVNVKVRLHDDQAEVLAALNGKPIVDWKGPQSALSALEEWGIPDRSHLGVGVWESEAVFRRIQVRALPEDARASPEKTTPERPTPKPKG
jgi:hypothetical protein